MVGAFEPPGRLARILTMESRSPRRMRSRPRSTCPRTSPARSKKKTTRDECLPAGVVRVAWQPRNDTTRPAMASSRWSMTSPRTARPCTTGVGRTDEHPTARVQALRQAANVQRRLLCRLHRGPGRNQGRPDLRELATRGRADNRHARGGGGHLHGPESVRRVCWVGARIRESVPVDVPDGPPSSDAGARHRHR